MSDTNHVATTVVARQDAITIRASHGEIELAQETDEWRAIYIRPENALHLVRAILCMIGLDDAQLYRDVGGSDLMGACEDIPWPDGRIAVSATEAMIMAGRPDIDWKAVKREADELGLDDEPQPKDRTAAERQRRRRSKQRDSDRDTVTVTPDERDIDRDMQFSLVAAE